MKRNGAHPSPGAETLASGVASESSKPDYLFNVSAPGDGRAPILAILLILATCMALSARAATSEGNLEKTFEVKPGGQLVVDVDSGPIWIASSDRPQVLVQVKRKVSGASGNEADKIFALHEVNLNQDGDHINVTARFKKEASG